MLYTHSPLSSRPRPPQDENAPIRVDIGAAKPIPHAIAAIRLACGDRATIEEGQALARALVDIVPLRNGALVSGPFDGGTHLHLLVEGWAYRAQGLRDGARQITDILVPGDICDWVPPASNEDIRVSGPARVAVLRRTVDGPDRQALSARRQRAVIGDIHRLRAQLTSLGRRDARGLVAYCIADLHRRLERVGLVRGGGFACPLTQEQLGDLLGLTSVHVNRVVQGLRRDDVLTIGRRQVTILDLTRLHAIAGWQADDVLPDHRSFALPRDGAPSLQPSATMNSRGLS